MDGTAFVGKVRNSSGFEPDENIFESIWGEYESVIVESLITSFGLDFIVRDQHGGDVDTILNVRKIENDPNKYKNLKIEIDPNMKYKNSQNKAAYDGIGHYDKPMANAYHATEQYKQINAKASEQKTNGELIDSYTGKKVARNANIDLDHVISAKEIHDDPGRILAGLDGKDLANCEENLCPTDRSINRSMRQTDMDDYLGKWKDSQAVRQARINELKAKNTLTDKERNELDKLNKLEEIDPELMKKENEKARKAYEAKVNKAYYTSGKFVKDTAIAAGKRGVEMGVRQALGFIFMEIWFCTKEELQTMPAGSELGEMIEAVGRGIKKGLERAKTKYKELLAKIAEGFGAGALSSLTTTICNIFFTTAKNLVKCIRQVYASVIQAGKVLLFNPDNLMFGDRIKAATVILATGASVLLGTAVGEVIENTPIGKAPVVGEIVKVFCSSMVSGLLSCTLLIFLDRSKFINRIIFELNRIPSDVNNYAQIADAMEQLAAKLSDIDIELFRKETERFADSAELISKCNDDDELNAVLYDTYKALDIQIPWEGDFDSFMGNKSNKLVFS